MHIDNCLKENNFDYHSFAKSFLKRYLEDGFATLAKKEVDLLVLDLLIKNSTIWSSNPPTCFELAKNLRVKRGRILSMTDELAYRNANENDIRDLLIQKIREGEIIRGNSASVKIQIENGLAREPAKEIVRLASGVVDTSFDRTIITLSPEKYLTLVTELVDPATKNTLEKQLKKNITVNDGEDLIKIFIGQFVAGAGQRSGVAAVDLGLAMLTPGIKSLQKFLSAIISPNE